MHPTEPILCKPALRKAPFNVSLDAFSELITQKFSPVVLGANPAASGQSIFAAEPVKVFEFHLHEENPFEKLAAILAKYHMPRTDSPLFSGGWIGFFGYELGRFIETLPGRAASDLSFPVIRLAFYDKAIVYDHAAGQFYLAALETDSPQSVEQKFETLRQWCVEAAAISPPRFDKTEFENSAVESFASNFTQEQYLRAISKIKHYIYDGDTYQINLSQRFQTGFTGRPIDIFRWQNRFNPSPYAAFLQWDDKAVVSASPELFLHVQGDHIITKPIKGTRPRNPLLADDEPENTRSFHALVESQKEQAELAMIVDLERNDLARICIPGTRHVICSRMIEAFPTVYHAAGIVEGKLKIPPGPERIIEILKATFPGGSITGAPKICSMEIIDELEPTARGIYTGSIGWISPSFDMCWNIAIRTILVENNTAFVQAGGGIVADSDAVAEYQETLAKARALVAGIQAANR